MRISVRPLSLGHRIVARVAVGLALVLALFGFVALWTIRETSEAAYGERVTLAEMLANRVDDMLRYALVTLEREVTDLTLERGQPPSRDQRQRLTELRDRIESFAVVSIADSEGIVVWTDPSPAPDFAVGTLLLSRSGLVLSNGTTEIAQCVPRVEGDSPFACLAVPLRDASGRLSGALVVEVDPGHSSLSLVPTGQVGQGIIAQLLNSDGRFLAGTADYSPRLATIHRMLLGDLVDAASAGYRIHEPGPGAPVPNHVVAYAPVSLLPSWGIVLEQPQDIVLDLPSRLQGRLAWFGLLALLAAAFVAWHDVRRVVRPLNALTAAAERFAAGHFEQPVRLERSDELGILAHAFETMRQRLRASLAEVAEWNRSALLEPERVIALVVQKAREVVGTDVAGLSLVEEGSEDITWRLLVGGSDRFREIRLGPTEGLAGHVVRTGRPLAIADWEHPPIDGPATAPILALEDLRAALAVPLQSGGRTFGALLVGNHAPTLFVADQVALLSSLADQAAVALENARLYAKVQDLAILEERERIAHEMHDGVGQLLAYVNVEMLALTRLLEQGQMEEARARVARIEAAAKEAYGDVREGILGLRATPTPERGFLVALGEYLEGFRLQSGLSVEVEAPGADEELGLSFSAEIQVLRIVQEALANVRKHARASRATVRLTGVEEVLRLVVEDDGQGFEPTAAGHEGRPRFGLQTMRERAEAIGGSLTVESNSGAGTRLTLTVPRAARAQVVELAAASTSEGR